MKFQICTGAFQGHQGNYLGHGGNRLRCLHEVSGLTLGSFCIQVLFKTTRYGESVLRITPWHPLKKLTDHFTKHFIFCLYLGYSYRCLWTDKVNSPKVDA